MGSKFKGIWRSGGGKECSVVFALDVPLEAGTLKESLLFVSNSDGPFRDFTQTCS